jgi:hypothetical protein
MAEHKAKDKDEQDEAPAYPAPPMTEEDHFAAAKHDEDARAKMQPKKD